MVFTLFFTAVDIVAQLILQSIHVLKKEILHFLSPKFAVYMRAVTDQERVMMACHSLLRLDATPKKRCLTKLFIFKKFSFKQAFFINDISSSQVKVHKQFSDPNQFSQSSKRSKCLSRYQKTKKNQKKITFFLFFSSFLHVSGQLLLFNGQPDLVSHLRDHSAIFAGFGDDFDTLGMSLELLWVP